MEKFKLIENLLKFYSEKYQIRDSSQGRLYFSREMSLADRNLWLEGIDIDPEQFVCVYGDKNDIDYSILFFLEGVYVLNINKHKKWFNKSVIQFFEYDAIKNVSFTEGNVEISLENGEVVKTVFRKHISHFIAYYFLIQEILYNTHHIFQYKGIPYFNAEQFELIGNNLRKQKDIDGAISFYNKCLLIDENRAAVHYALGLIYGDKEDLEHYDIHKYLDHMTRAGKLGVADAAYNVGWFYIYSGIVEKNLEEGFPWYMRGASLGDKPSVKIIASALRDGYFYKKNQFIAYLYAKAIDDKAIMRQCERTFKETMEALKVNHDLAKKYVEDQIELLSQKKITSPDYKLSNKMLVLAEQEKKDTQKIYYYYQAAISKNLDAYPPLAACLLDLYIHTPNDKTKEYILHVCLYYLFEALINDNKDAFILIDILYTDKRFNRYDLDKAELYSHLKEIKEHVVD